MSTHTVTIAIPFAALLVAGACGSAPEAPPESAESSAAAEAQTQRFDIRAEVVGVAPERREVVLDHEEIVGYMAAMAMPFTVEDQSLLEDIELGDRVTAVLAVTDGEAVVVQLDKVEQVERPEPVPAQPEGTAPPDPPSA